MNLLAPASLLGQVRPSGTTSTTAFTATQRTEITRIEVCNTGSGAVTYRVFVDKDGTTHDQTTAIRWDESIATGGHASLEAQSLGVGWVIEPDGTVGVRADTANDVTFSMWGVVQPAR